MKLWVKKLLVFVVAGVSYLLGQYFRGAWFLHFPINVCGHAVDSAGVFCNSPYMLTVGWPLIDLGKMLLLIAVILLAANRSSFRSWLKFSAFYIPIALILMWFIYPLRFFPGAPLLTYGTGVRPFGSLYVIVTLAMVLWGLFAYRVHSHPSRS